MGKVISDAGFDDAGLTVRPGGQVLPENAKKYLPLAFKAGAGIPAIVISITDANEKYTEQILGTAAYPGIKYY